jgi:hypothetical protein
MKAVYALYSSPHHAQRAVDDLRAAGFADPQITVLSSEPLEEYEFGQRDRKTLMSWVAGAGALVGLATGYFLTSITQNLWPIHTGGMPIVTNWTNLIVIFELTMLGAVLSTVITLLVTAKIPNRRPELYDKEVSYGKILIGVANPKDSEAVERVLLLGGKGVLKTLR